MHHDEPHSSTAMLQLLYYKPIWIYLLYISLYIHIYIHIHYIYIFLYYFDLCCIHDILCSLALTNCITAYVPSRHRSEVGGFRIDAVPFLLEDPQLRNEVSHVWNVWNVRKHRSKHEVEKLWKMWNCWSFELCDILKFSLGTTQLRWDGRECFLRPARLNGFAQIYCQSKGGTVRESSRSRGAAMKCWTELLRFVQTIVPI